MLAHSAYMMVHPAFIWIGSWDIRLEGVCEGCAWWSLDVLQWDALQCDETRREPWAKLRGEGVWQEARVVNKLWHPELIHMHPTCHMTAPRCIGETS